MIKKLALLLIISSFIQSCRTQHDVLYFPNIDEINYSMDNYKSPTIQEGDVMTIVVNSYNPELSAPFNLGEGIETNRIGSGSAELNPNAYLVDSDGTIEFPMIGTIQAAGKTRKELTRELKTKISEYIAEPMVNIRIMNFRVTMLGEVNRPGVVQSTSEKLSITEAIAMSGDLSYYAIKDSVLLIRTIDGHRKHSYLNLQDAELINSPYYYLRQNDIVYVMPTKSKAMEFNTKPLTATLTVIGFLTAMFALFR